MNMSGITTVSAVSEYTNPQFSILVADIIRPEDMYLMHSAICTRQHVPTNNTKQCQYHPTPGCLVHLLQHKYYSTVHVIDSIF